MRKQELFLFIGIIVFVAVIFFTYVFISLFSSEQPSVSPIPSSLPTSSSHPFDSLINSPSAPPPIILPSSLPSPVPGEPTKNSLINLMPVQTDFANIEYLSSVDAFAVTIKKNPYQENRARVEEWFENVGFNPSQLNIYWQTYPEVTTE